MRKRRPKRRKHAGQRIRRIGLPAVAVCAAAAILVTTVIIPGQKYRNALSLLDTGDYAAGYAILEELGKPEEITQNKYDRAMALIDAGDYAPAYVLLEEIGDTETVQSNKYERAMTLIDAGDYDPAYTLLKEIGETETIQSSKYDRAMEQIDAGEYEAAYKLLDGLEYKDSAEKQKSIWPQYNRLLLERARVGDTIIFGTYEQDNDKFNGKEDIEWLVLAKKDNRLLVISQYGLDYQEYNTKFEDVTWESCTLRKWLNGAFLNTAFSNEEKTMIPTVTVSADQNPDYSTNPGSTTEDNVFLLSITEAKRYFKTDEARMCVPTAYAKANNAYLGDAATYIWWLRSPGRSQRSAACVDYDGGVDSDGSRGYAVHSGVYVRPAMWISLED